MIMRRVYYSYLLSIMTHTVFWQGMFLGIAGLLLADWLHVASIINNFLSVPVGLAPQYLINTFLGAIANGKVLTVALVVLAGVVAVSASYQLGRALFLYHNRLSTVV